MTDPELLVERRDAVTVLTLNRPDARNALTPSLMRAIGTAMLSAESDPEVRAVVITGSGDRAFCAGLDLRAFTEGPLDLGSGDDIRAFYRLLRGGIEVPLVGAANGSALAGGLELLLSCDLIVLAEGARLGLPEVARGLFAAGGGTFLGTRIPLSVALEIALTGDPFDAERALALGLANRVEPGARVLPVALDYAERIAANGPLAVRVTKELVRLGVNDADAAWERLAELQPLVFNSADAQEGALAFLEKRPPRWTGR